MTTQHDEKVLTGVLNLEHVEIKHTLNSGDYFLTVLADDDYVFEFDVLVKQDGQLLRCPFDTHSVVGARFRIKSRKET